MGVATGPASFSGAGSLQREESECCFRHTLIVGGSPTTPNVVLEGSADGSNWFQLAITAASQGATVTTNAATTTGVFVTSNDVPLQFVRGRVVSLAGGTVTVSVVSAGS